MTRPVHQPCDRIEQIAAQHERRMAGLEARRCKADDRAYDRLYRRMEAAEPLIRKLCRDGRTVYFINMRRRDDTMTGKAKEGSRHDLIAWQWVSLK